MRTLLKTVAILALIVTIGAAGVVLYGLNTLTPQVVSVSQSVVEAADDPQRFEEIAEQMQTGAFSGKIFLEGEEPAAEDCRFVTYSVRIQNKGFFPAEWIHLDVVPVASADGSMSDIARLGDERAYVLHRDTMGDLNATILTSVSGTQPARTLRVECYVIGRKITFDIPSQN